MKEIFNIDYVKKLTSEGKEEEAFSYCLRFAEQDDADAQNYIGNYYSMGLGIEKDAIKAVEWYKKAVELGNSKAMFNLATHYLNGDGIPSDPDIAVKWYTKAAELGNSIAMYNLGVIFSNGDFIPQSKETAVGWFEKAAKAGNSKAMFILATYYDIGDVVIQNKGTAAEWYAKAAELGVKDAMFNLAICYENGEGVAQSYETAVEWYKKAADLGDSKAMFHLGMCCCSGRGIPKNEVEAVEWYLKAAILGNSDAMYNLAHCYMYGAGVPRDKANALKWLTKAADSGNMLAMFTLGLAYGGCYGEDIGVQENYTISAKWLEKSTIIDNGIGSSILGSYYYLGTGVRKNYKKAAEYFEKASNNNESYSSFYLGICYSKGKGVKKDKKRALELFKKAVYNDDFPYPKAQYLLACLYADGDGVEKDLCEAANLFLEAAEQNHPDAQLRIAKCFADGVGVEQNDEKASYWYIEAANAGITEALYEAGQCYEYGIGVDEDEIKAVSYYRLAVEKGIKEAERHLRKLERSISINQENEERISALVDQLRQKECELAAEREKQKNGIQIADLQQQLLEMRKMMMSGFDYLRAVSNDTNRVVNDTNSRVNDIQSQLSSLSDYLVKDLPNVLKEKRRESGCDSLTTINTDELSENDEKKVGNFCSSVRRIIENQIREKNDLISNSREELEKRMGGIWSEFSPDTRNSLVSAMTLLRAYRNVSDECFDFSGIGILATSALENELRRIFLIDFQKFALNQAEGDISAIPKQLRYYDSKNGQWILSDPEHFALGQIPYIFGQTGMKENDMGDIELLKKFRESYLGSIVDRDIKAQKNLSSFSEYFTKAVFSSEGSDVPEKHWMCYCPGSMIYEFEAVRKTRNQSAHAGGLGRDDAEKCCAKIIGSDFVEESQNKIDHVVGLLEKLYILLGKRK